MRVIDPGHTYELNHLDGDGKTIIDFVKREGEKYPGNVGHHEGTNIQEVLRACIDRLQYVDRQIPDRKTMKAMKCLREAIMELEDRAAERHLRQYPDYSSTVERMPVCDYCGHIECYRNCR